MKKGIIALLIASLPMMAFAQFEKFANKVKNKITQKTNQRVDNKVDKAIDKGLDEAEGKKNTSAAAPKTETAATGTVTSTENNAVKSFAKYDFIPGEKLLYTEDFLQEAVGELPTGWNTSGSGEVVSLNNFSGNWLRLHGPFMYLTANATEFPENYTAEFDLILQLKNNGWMYPTLAIGFLSSGSEASTANKFLDKYYTYSSVMATLFPQENNGSRLTLESTENGKQHFRSDSKNYGELQEYYGKPVHIAIQVQKERYRMWINSTKLFDIPKAVATSYKMNQLFFKVSHTNYKEDQYGIYISNIKIATGLPDTRHKLVDEGKFSTTGILFDVNAASIKPESYGVIKEIAAVMKEHESIKVKITGHTSSDGDDKSNLDLSKKRSAAVKEALMNDFGIEESRLQTDGKGESQPIADNKTKEGKSANRRVEFTKM